MNKYFNADEYDHQADTFRALQDVVLDSSCTHTDKMRMLRVLIVEEDDAISMAEAIRATQAQETEADDGSTES